MFAAKLKQTGKHGPDCGIPGQGERNPAVPAMRNLL